MANYKNRKPKPFKGCCGMCCLMYSDGRRNGRLPNLQELRAKDAEDYYWTHEHGEEHVEEEESNERDYSHDR